MKTNLALDDNGLPLTGKRFHLEYLNLDGKLTAVTTCTRYVNGFIHCDDGPAKTDVLGNKLWYKNGKLHREDGPALVLGDGTTGWYKNGKEHRIGGPACEWASGTKSWWKNGKRHRLDGPAFEFDDGDKKWFINDVELTEEQFLARK